MVEFSCSRTSEDRTPVIRDVEIAKFAERVLYDYRPELMTYTSLGEDPYYTPALLDPYDFATGYLGANIEVHDIYTETKGDVIAGAAVFNLQRVKVFDKANMCTREILVPPDTILLDTGTVDHWHKGFEFFTIMHEVGHLMLHRQVYRTEPGQGSHTSGNAVLCMRSNIGRSSGGLKTSGDFIEHQADTFAASMLMPPRLFIPFVQMLMERYRYFRDEGLMITYDFSWGSPKYGYYLDVVNSTARYFGVSLKAAKVQMTRYGLRADPKEADVKEAGRRLKMYQSLYR